MGLRRDVLVVRLGKQRGRGATWLETEVFGEAATVDLVGWWIIWGGRKMGRPQMGLDEGQQRGWHVC